MAKHPYGPNNFLRLFENGWEKRTGGARQEVMIPELRRHLQ